MSQLLVFGVDQYAGNHHRGAAGLCLILTFVLSFWVHFSGTWRWVLVVGLLLFCRVCIAAEDIRRQQKAAEVMMKASAPHHTDLPLNVLAACVWC